jgi:hypothetical protein
MDTDKDFADIILFIRAALLAKTVPSVLPVYYSELLNIKRLHFGRISLQVLAKQENMLYTYNSLLSVTNLYVCLRK